MRPLISSSRADGLDAKGKMDFRIRERRSSMVAGDVAVIPGNTEPRRILRSLISANQLPSLNLRLARLLRFSPIECRRQLKHSGLLSLVKQSQKNNLAVREFQGVVVRSGNALIDLAEDRRLLLDSAAVPRPQTRPFNLVCEGQFCAGQ